MNIRSKALTFLAVLSTGGLLAHSAPNPNHIRYSVNEAFVTAVPGARAAGRAQATLRQDGTVTHQRLRVALQRLNPRTPYTLLATTGEDTNWVAVAEFVSTAAGRGVATYTQTRSSSARVRSGAPAFPAGLDLLSTVRSLAVANTNGDVVLTANLHESSSMQFELARVLVNTGNDPSAVGCVAVACQSGGVQFHLLAAGQGNQFTFCVNDSPIATYTADLSGRINVGSLPFAAPSPLAFQKLCLKNSGNETVLESE